MWTLVVIAVFSFGSKEYRYDFSSKNECIYAVSMNSYASSTDGGGMTYAFCVPKDPEENE